VKITRLRLTVYFLIFMCVCLALASPVWPKVIQAGLAGPFFIGVYVAMNLWAIAMFCRALGTWDDF